jgi:hypothetical protein
MYQSSKSKAEKVAVIGIGKRWASLVIVFLTLLLAAQLWLPSRILAEEPISSKQAEKVLPHSEQMRHLLASDRSDAEDRTFDVLYDVQQQIRVVRRNIKTIRAALLLQPSEASESELASYVKAAESLGKIKKALNTIQANMSQCTAACAKAELAAGEGKPEPMTHHKKMTEYTRESSDALKAFRKSLADLKVSAEETSDARLAGLVKDLSAEADVLGKVIGICNTSLGETYGSSMREGESHKAKDKKSGGCCSTQ